MQNKVLLIASAMLFVILFQSCNKNDWDASGPQENGQESTEKKGRDNLKNEEEPEEPANPIAESIEAMLATSPFSSPSRPTTSTEELAQEAQLLNNSINYLVYDLGMDYNSLVNDDSLSNNDIMAAAVAIKVVDQVGFGELGSNPCNLIQNKALRCLVSAAIPCTIVDVIKDELGLTTENIMSQSLRTIWGGLSNNQKVKVIKTFGKTVVKNIPFVKVVAFAWDLVDCLEEGDYAGGDIDSGCPIPSEFFNSDRVYFNHHKDDIINHLMYVDSDHYTFEIASFVVEAAYQARCDLSQESVHEVGVYFTTLNDEP